MPARRVLSTAGSGSDHRIASVPTRLAPSTGDGVRGSLPAALHDAGAARAGSFVYLFGGGDGISQHDEIIRVDPTSWQTTLVGRLPHGSSDQSGTAIGGTAYIVGGF